MFEISFTNICLKALSNAAYAILLPSGDNENLVLFASIILLKVELDTTLDVIHFPCSFNFAT